MSAARVALKVNIAALELVRRLPIDELSAIGVYLAAAFNETEESVDISWIEVGSLTEREWHEAERSWDRFSGRPYDVYEMEKQSEDSALQRSLRRFEETERNRLRQHGSPYVAEWLAYRGHHRSLTNGNSASAQSDNDDASRLYRESTGGGSIIAAAGLFNSRSDFSAMELTAIELKAILRAERLVKTPSTTSPDSPIELKAIPQPSDSSDKGYIRGSWSHGKGARPIMSNEEFEALPDYTDVEDDPNW
ncbi:hypothetical protein E8E11_001720 [Didymella keratinophila]|nr:hypothetical protein E8E11_001720 [Didymella keratinophila]